MENLQSEVPSEEKFKEVATEWKRVASALEESYGDDSIPQTEWDDLIKNHITTNLQPIKRLENEGGEEYGQVYDKNEVKAIFGGDELPLPSGDIWNQIQVE